MGVARITLLLLTVGLADGCTPARQDGTGGAGDGTQGGSGAVVQADTLRGVVRITGAEPAVTVVLETPARSVALYGGGGVLPRLDGLDVMVQGSARDGGGFDVAHFAVRALDGVPAMDGVLQREGAAFHLLAGDGVRHALPHLPPSLRDAIGARIWLAGPLSAAPEAYGIIQRR
jgi:hypothetical protein